MPLVVMFLELISLVYKIIEGVIRALIEVAITGVMYIVIAFCGFVLGCILLRYGWQESDDYLQYQAVKCFVVVVTGYIAICIAYTVVKRTMELRQTN